MFENYRIPGKGKFFFFYGFRFFPAGVPMGRVWPPWRRGV
ncbi:hypothetical protein EBI_27112 [Enterocytozoon bieneusi H348]|nr:hypothetical protein EBI_27112 [Enterocytozoon bieneusi H348]|eukprot:XP_002651249.1 hypothetical protein EBI_27112 [Enterocytozoon bieneusi H348]